MIGHPAADDAAEMHHARLGRDSVEIARTSTLTRSEKFRLRQNFCP